MRIHRHHTCAFGSIVVYAANFLYSRVVADSLRIIIFKDRFLTFGILKGVPCLQKAFFGGLRMINYRKVFACNGLV